VAKLKKTPCTLRTESLVPVMVMLGIYVCNSETTSSLHKHCGLWYVSESDHSERVP